MDWMLGALLVMVMVGYLENRGRKRRRYRVKGTQCGRPISAYYEPRGWKR